MKLVISEHESRALKAHLRRAAGPVVSSALAVVEVARTVRLVDDGSKARATVAALFQEVALHRVGERVLRRARDLDPPLLRSLDAIHLATALELGVAAMLVYDTRLGDAAQAHGIAVLSPGA